MGSSFLLIVGVWYTRTQKPVGYQIHICDSPRELEERLKQVGVDAETRQLVMDYLPKVSLGDVILAGFCTIVRINPDGLKTSL